MSWQQSWELPASTSLQQFARLLDSVSDYQSPIDADPDLTALDELEPLEDAPAWAFSQDAIDWIGGAA